MAIDPSTERMVEDFIIAIAIANSLSKKYYFPSATDKARCCIEHIKPLGYRPQSRFGIDPTKKQPSSPRRRLSDRLLLGFNEAVPRSSAQVVVSPPSKIPPLRSEARIGLLTLASLAI